MAKQATYADSGVDIILGDEASGILYQAARLTWENRKGNLGEVVELFSDFSGIRSIRAGMLPADTCMGSNTDGIGTKVELGQRSEKHDTAAHDLFAMVCDDAVVRGAEPVALVSDLSVRTVRENGKDYIDLVKQLASGYVKAAGEANVAVLNGEFAELGTIIRGYSEPYSFFERLRHSFDYLLKGKYPPVRGFHYTWSAAVIWFARESRMLKGNEVKEDDKIVGLKEEGFRSNGLSLFRKIMEDTHGRMWHKVQYEGKGLAEAALFPSKIYCRAVADMIGGFYKEPKAEIHGVAHITGGGIPGKLRRVLKPTGLGAQIEEPFNPCSLMKYCQDAGNVSDEEAYRTWNMGNGMIIITPEPEKVIEAAKGHGIESKVIGEVTEKPGIRIKSKGVHSYNSQLNFD